MKTINLLPKERQSEIKYEDRYKVALKFFVISCACFVVVAFLQISARVYLAAQLKGIENDITTLRASINKKENAEIKVKINEVNNLILDFQSLSKNSPRLAPVLKALAANVPAGVSITSLSVNSEKLTVNIAGTSPNREGVLSLYDNISKDKENFSNIDYPLENLSQPTNVNFHYSFQVAPKLIQQVD